MKTIRLFPLEFGRLLQNRLTWLIVLLTVISPAAGLFLYKPVFCCTGEQIAEVNTLFRVQAHRGLVKNQEGRIPQQSLRNTYPLTLAAGEGADFGYCLFFQIDRLNCLLDSGLGI